jgi:hypothetical protein
METETDHGGAVGQGSGRAAGLERRALRYTFLDRRLQLSAKTEGEVPHQILKSESNFFLAALAGDELLALRTGLGR